MRGELSLKTEAEIAKGADQPRRRNETAAN
jgi:hypothetical protein